MFFRGFFSTVALALTASAFLVSPEVADKTSADEIKPLNGVPSYYRESIRLDCNGCSFAGAANIDSFLDINIANDGKQITLNDIPIYPNDPRHPPLPLTAKQVTGDKKIVKGEELLLHWVSLSYSLETTSEVPFKDAMSTAMILQILGVDDKVANVDAILLGVIKKPNGELILHTVKTAPPKLSPAVSECTTILCRIKATIAEKIAAIRAAMASKFASIKGGCMRKFGKGGHPGPSVKGGPAKFDGKSPPKGAHGNHRHHHSPTVSKICHTIRRAFRHIVMPILIGVAAGMSATALGMLIGQIAHLLWVRYRRARGAEYTPIAQTEAVEEEGLPKYEELEGQVDVDEKKEGW